MNALDATWYDGRGSRGEVELRRQPALEPGHEPFVHVEEAIDFEPLPAQRILRGVERVCEFGRQTGRCLGPEGRTQPFESRKVVVAEAVCARRAEAFDQGNVLAFDLPRVDEPVRGMAHP